MTGRMLAVLVFAAVACWGQLSLPLFKDVPTSATYYNEVNMLRERLITQGCQASPQMFCPDYWPNGYTPYFLTRGQAATLIIRSLFSGLSGDPEKFTASETSYFTDVQWDHPQLRYIQKLKELGITSGCTATEFCPERELSYGEFSVFVYRARRKKEMNDANYNVSPPPACTYDLFADVLSSHPFCAYIREVYYAVGSNAISPECPSGYYCPDVAFNPYGQWVGGVRVKRGTASFYLVKGILKADYPHILATSNGQLYTVSREGPPEDCQYGGPAMSNMVLVAGSQLFGWSLTTMSNYSDPEFWSFVVAPKLIENLTVRYPLPGVHPMQHATAGTTGAAEVYTPQIPLNPANNYEHPVAHEIASACSWGGNITANSLPYPTLFSVDQPVLYRGMYQQVSYRGMTLEGANAANARSAYLNPGTSTAMIVPANVSNWSKFGATLGFVTPATTPAGYQVLSLLAEYTPPLGVAGPAAAVGVSVYVADPTPVLTSLSRYSGTQSEVSLTVELRGGYFGANPKVCWNSACTNGIGTLTINNGVTLTQGTCTNCTTANALLSVTISIASNAMVGSYTISVLSQGGAGNGFAPGPQGQTQPQSGGQTFQVNPAGPPSISSLSPDHGVQNTTGTVAVVGTNFINPAVSIGGTGVTITNVTVVSSTRLDVQYGIDLAAATGARPLIVTTPAGSASSSFHVLPQVTFQFQDAVPKNGQISATVEMAAGEPVTLKLATENGTGTAYFQGGLTEMVITQTTSVTILGVLESSTVGNVLLTARSPRQSSGEAALAAMHLTVVWVTLSLRTGNLVAQPPDTVSLDNDARPFLLFTLDGDLSLGARVLTSAGTCSNCRGNCCNRNAQQLQPNDYVTKDRAFQHHICRKRVKQPGG